MFIKKKLTLQQGKVNDNALLALTVGEGSITQLPIPVIFQAELGDLDGAAVHYASLGTHFEQTSLIVRKSLFLSSELFSASRDPEEDGIQGQLAARYLNTRTQRRQGEFGMPSFSYPSYQDPSREFITLRGMARNITKAIISRATATIGFILREIWRAVIFGTAKARLKLMWVIGMCKWIAMCKFWFATRSGYLLASIFSSDGSEKLYN
ncbi:hypothetical protein DFS33DRAFT_1271054 [Desarmillaria ectypa]|nr:hypothetical protein DFS33DRAFT_1271054 [Desarmillaria ectypa]